MDFRVIPKKMPGRPTEPEKYYAIIVRPKKATLEVLAKRISEISPVNELDTKSVLLALTHVLPEYLVLGASTELGDLGQLMVNISSEGADTEEDFDKELIKGCKISYFPSAKVKKMLLAVTYEKVAK